MDLNNIYKRQTIIFYALCKYLHYFILYRIYLIDNPTDIPQNLTIRNFKLPPKSKDLNDSQYKALQHCVSNTISIVQGGPGIIARNGCG